MNAEERLAQLIQVGEDLAAFYCKEEEPETFDFEIVSAEVTDPRTVFPFDSFFRVVSTIFDK